MHCRTWNVHPCAVCSVSREALAWRFNHACMHRRTLPGGICGFHLALCNSTYFSYSSSLGFEFNRRHGNRAAAVTHTHARPKINKNPKARARAETAVWGRRCYHFKWMVEGIIVNSRPHFCSSAPFAFRSQPRTLTGEMFDAIPDSRPIGWADSASLSYTSAVTAWMEWI